MPAAEKRTVSLSAEQAAFIDSQVASGAYATASEVVRDGLRALQARDAAIERWLREEVAPAYDEMKAHPERAIPLERCHARHPQAARGPRQGRGVKRRV